eukprot:1659534-Alexandrium_andersonii.AAC.1
MQSSLSCRWPRNFRNNPVSFPAAFVRRVPWPPPGQGAPHVQHFPAAHAVARTCTCGGPAACVRVLRPV